MRIILPSYNLESAYNESQRIVLLINGLGVLNLLAMADSKPTKRHTNTHTGSRTGSYRSHAVQNHS